MWIFKRKRRKVADNLSRKERVNIYDNKVARITRKLRELEKAGQRDSEKYRHLLDMRGYYRHKIKLLGG